MSRKHNKNRTAPAPQAAVNTLGIDIEPLPAPEDAGQELNPVSPLPAESYTEEELAGFELPDGELAFDEELCEPQLLLADRIINYSTLALAMLLLGGSLVFWWIIGRSLAIDPSRLVDSDQMRAVLICCAILPVFITVAQVLLRRALNVERWLINMCLSGAASALLVVFYQMVIKGSEFGFSDYFALICCTVSGAALPSAICMGIRWLLPVLRRRAAQSRTERAMSGDFEQTAEDIRSFTDFDLL